MGLNSDKTSKVFCINNSVNVRSSALQYRDRLMMNVLPKSYKTYITVMTLSMLVKPKSAEKLLALMTWLWKP